MNSSIEENRTLDDMPNTNPNPVGFVRWTAICFACWAVGQAVFLAIAAVLLNLPIQKLAVPFVLLAWCGYVGAVLIYWARRPYAKPMAPIRFAWAIFLFLSLYLGALVFSAYTVRLLSLESALYDYGPYVVVGSALTSAMVYAMARRLAHEGT